MGMLLSHHEGYHGDAETLEAKPKRERKPRQAAPEAPAEAPEGTDGE